MNSLAIFLAVALSLFAGVSGGQSLRPVPKLEARVTDLTGTLSTADRERLGQELAAIEKRKGAQVAVLVVPTTKPEPIEDFSIRVVDAWKLGRAEAAGRKVDDGVLLLVAKDDRRMGIEVGYGLEGAIPDAIAKRIVAETMAPRFREGDFAGGLAAAVADIGRLIDGEPLPEPWRVGAGGGGGGEETASARPESISGLLVVLVGGMIATAVVGRLVGSSLGGAGAGAWAALVGAPLLLAVLVAVVAFVLFMVFAAAGGGGLSPSTGGRGRTGPVWTGGGSGWRSSGGGSGGFGGGGGGFGGGGASGSW